MGAQLPHNSLFEFPRALVFGSRPWIDLWPGLNLWQTHDLALHRRIVCNGPRASAVLAVQMELIQRFGRICIVHGAADGADTLADIIAEQLGQQRLPFKINPALDGIEKWAGNNRNIRMWKESQPIVEAHGFVIGRVGSPLTPGSRHMASVVRKAKCRLIVHRDNGIEPAQEELFS